jgi:hypothetical protein
VACQCRCMLDYEVFVSLYVCVCVCVLCHEYGYAGFVDWCVAGGAWRREEQRLERIAAEGFDRYAAPGSSERVPQLPADHPSRKAV